MVAKGTRILTLESKLAGALREPDRQSTTLRELEIADPEFANAFETHFSGSTVLADPEKIRAATVLFNSIRRGAVKQLDAIIEMGRALIRAESIFTKTEWNHLLEGGPKLLGLPKNTASMYRAVARDIDSGRLPRALCPESFSTAYVFTTFEDQRLILAKSRGILRPTVTRREVEEFKRPPLEFLLNENTRAGIHTIDSNDDSLVAKLARLREREATLLKQLQRVRSEISALQ